MNLLAPGPIKKGDTAYIISPSAGLIPFVPARVKRAAENLAELGLKVKIAAHADQNAGYVSASIEDRVADIHTAFADDKCTLIMAAIGGNHSNQLLSQLDFDFIAKHPKAFIGYSDITVLHWAFATQAKLKTFYGPCFLNQFGEFPEPVEYTIKHFIDTVMDQTAEQTITPSVEYTDEVLDWFKNLDASRARKFQPNKGLAWWKDGLAKGWALPGAIPSLNHLLGTKYFPDPGGAILMLDIPEGNTMHEGQSISEVDSWLTDIDNAGVLAKLKGIIIARPYKYTAEMIAELREVILRITEPYDYPIAYNLDFGHTDPMITIPLGASVTLDSTKTSIELSEEMAAK